MVWKDRTANAWPPKDVDEGDAVEGTILRVEENVNATPENKLFDYVLDVKGEELRVWGSKMLNLQLEFLRDCGQGCNRPPFALAQVRTVILA